MLVQKLWIGKSCLYQIGLFGELNFVKAFTTEEELMAHNGTASGSRLTAVHNGK